MAAPAKKTTAKKKPAARKKPAAKKAPAKRASASRASTSRAKKPAAKRAPAKKAPAKRAAAKTNRAADRADKSVEAFREALERSIREIVDDAAKRGRMTRDDANELVSKLVTRGRKQTEDLLADLEKAIEQARKDLDTRSAKARKRVETRTTKARKRVEAQTKKARREVETRAKKARKTAEKNVGKARKSAVDVADEPLAQADKLRARAGLPGFPITAYDELTVPQIKSRVKDLNKADARKVRTYEKQGKARKSVLDTIEKRLAA
jgi:polyhydroxyalkanoate synthesis regulator phasin